MRPWAAAWLLAVAVFAAGCGGGGGSTGTQAVPVSIASFTLASANTGISYPISVYVPAGASSTHPLPVIYALDAETRFDNLLAVLQAKNTNAILVGIGNTSAARRQIDFLMPGAIPYYHFLVDELAPQIESRYPADPSRRMLSGHSSSGLFAGYAFFMESPANRRFAVFISAEGSFWQQLAEVAQAEQTLLAVNGGHDLPVTLLLGGDATSNLPYVQQVYQAVLAANYPGLRLAKREYNTGHVAMDVPFFTDAIAILFAPGT